MRGLGSLAACTVLLAAPGQLAAQSASPTPDDDLDCAVLFSVALGERGDAASDREKLGLTLALGYFAGRYEAARGDRLDSAMAAATRGMTPEKLQAIGTPCAQRLTAVAERFEGMSAALRAKRGTGEAK